MSWPQWPQPPTLPPQAGSTTSVPSVPIAAPSTAAAPTAQPSTYSAGMQPPAQYTAAQFAALTPEQQFAIQQNWQQWQTYHQQYAQWHAQYGEQYQREMQAKLGAVAPSIPYVPPMPPYAQPSPTFNVPPPLPAQANSGQQISNMAAAACQPPPPPPPPEESVKESMQPAPPQPVTAPNYPGFLSLNNALSQYGGSAGQKSDVPPQPSGPPPQQPQPPKPPGPPPNVGLSHYSSQPQFSNSQQFPNATQQYNTAPPPLPTSYNSASQQQNAPQQRNYPPPLMQIDPHSVAPPDSYRQNQNQNSRRDQQSQNWRQNEGRNFRDNRDNRNDRRSRNDRGDNRNFQDRDRFDDCQDNSDWKSENRNPRKDEGPQVLKSFNSYANEDDSEKTPEERAFDEQFRKWEEEFENWKKQNANHPDRKAYSEYEMKFEDCRRKLLERREQMRKRKLERKLREEQEKDKLQPHAPDKSDCPDRPERLHRPDQQVQNIMENQTSQNQEQPRVNIMAEQMDTKTEEAKTENTEVKDGNEGAKVEEKIEFLKTTSQSDGIPGLDLLPETGKSEDSEKADEDAEVIDLEEENKLAFDQEDDNQIKDNEGRISYISSNKSEIPSLLSQIVEKPSFSPDGKDLSFGDFLRKETVHKIDENPFHSQDRKEIPLLDEAPKPEDYKQPGNIINPFAGPLLTDSKLTSNPEPSVREEKGISPGKNNEHNLNPNLMSENMFRNIPQESNPENNMETNPGGGVNDLAQALADPNVLALLSAALSAQAGGNVSGIAELGALLTQGNQAQNQMNQPRVSPWIAGQAPFSGQNQVQNTRFNQGNNFDGNNRNFPGGNIWQDKNRGDSGNSPWGNRNADINDNRRNSLLWRDNPWQNNSNFGDQRNSSFDDQRFGDARKQGNFDDQRNSRFGDNRNSSFDDQRNPRFGDQRSNYDDQRNSRFGDRNSRFGDQRNSKFGDQRNSSFGEQRNPNFGDQRNSSFGDQRNSNLGDQRNSNFGDQRSSNFGDQRNSSSSFGEKRNSNFGDQRNQNFGDQRNANFGDQRNANFNDQRNTNVEDQRNPNFGEQSNTNFGDQRNSNLENKRNLSTDRNTSFGGGPRKSRFDNPSDAGFGGNKKDTTTEEQANSNTENIKEDVTDPKDNVPEQPKPTNKQDDIDMRDSVFERSSVGSHKDDRSRSSDKFSERVNPFKDSDDRNRANPFKDNDDRGTRGASRTGDRRSGSNNRNSRDRSRSSSRHHDDASNLDARRNPFRSEGNIFDKPPDNVGAQDNYFRPTHVIDYQNKPLGGGGAGGDSFGGQNDMLCPTKIVDYGHMPSNQPSKCDDDYFPMKTIDYGHSSANTVSDYDHRSNSQSFKFQNQRSKRRNKKSGLESNPSYPNGAWCLLNPESRTRPGLPSKRGKRKKRQIMNELTNMQVGKKFLSDENVTAQATENCEEISDDDNQEFDEPPQSADIPECGGEMEPIYIDDNSPQNFSDALSNIFPSVFPINNNNNSSSLNKSENIMKAKCSTIVEYNTKNTISIKDILCKPGRFSRPKKICIIFRGPPGSGKSYFAKLIKDKEVEMGGSAPRILSIDDYFMTEVDKEEKCPKTGIKITKREMVYEYEKEMEDSYMQYLLKAFKKTIMDRLFDFIIIDCHNHSLKLYNEFYNVAKENQFTPYTIDLLCDIQICLERNIHNRLEDDIRQMIDTWSTTPEEYTKLDVRALLEGSDAIREIEMEDISDMEDELDQSQESNQNSYETIFIKSKWDTDPFEDKLARLDGTNKVLQKAKNITLEEYLQMDGWEPPASTSSNKKRVRWADIEEKREQDKMRAIGFVVGQTDWNRMMDPTGGSSALTKTKYIARVKKN